MHLTITSPISHHAMRITIIIYITSQSAPLRHSPGSIVDIHYLGLLVSQLMLFNAPTATQASHIISQRHPIQPINPTSTTTVPVQSRPSAQSHQHTQPQTYSPYSPSKIPESLYFGP